MAFDPTNPEEVEKLNEFLQTEIEKREDETNEEGEIGYLRTLIGDDFPKCLMDVGAYDGKTISNVHFFIKSGYSAVMVEPLPIAFEKLTANYADNDNVHCVNKACSDKPGRQPLYYGCDGYDGMMSTLCTDDDEWFRLVRSTESVEVEVDTLTNILNDLSFPSDFTLLSVDAEAMDYEVLCGLDFEQYKPRIIVTEEYTLNVEKHDAKYKLLEDNGYTLNKILGPNSIWIYDKGDFSFKQQL